MTDRSVTEFADQSHLRMWSNILFIAKIEVYQSGVRGREKMFSSLDLVGIRSCYQLQFVNAEGYKGRF